MYLGSRCLQIGGPWSAHGLHRIFALHIVAKLLCFCLPLIDAIVKLHAMLCMKILSMIFSLESESGLHT